MRGSVVDGLRVETDGERSHSYPVAGSRRDDPRVLVEESDKGPERRPGHPGRSPGDKSISRPSSDTESRDGRLLCETAGKGGGS